MRLPSVYREHELSLRTSIGRQLIRGKVECIITIETNDASRLHTINNTLIGHYYNELVALEKQLGIAPSQNLMEVLLKMPEVFSFEREVADPQEWAYILNLVEEAVGDHQAFRAEEGKSIYSEFIDRIHAIREAFEQLATYEKERIDNIKHRIFYHFEAVAGKMEVDKNRFEQELIYYLEKIDISEEKQRLNKHLDYFLSTVDAPSSQGKKLGFITQEIGREINTLGAKSYHPEMQQLVVQMKDELEKIKEQTLNTL